MSGARFVKLVRDGVGEFWPAGSGAGDVRYLEIPDPERVRTALRAKLVEEALEYALEPSLGELADVYEVVRALVVWDLMTAATTDEGIVMVADAARAKRDERGGFELGMGMWVATIGPGGEPWPD